jgi:hypothetical protein
MDPRRHQQDPDRRIMEEVPQEPIAADPAEEGEPKAEFEEEEDEDDVWRPVEVEDEPR